MKTLQLKIEDSLYETLLPMLKSLPEEKIEIVEKQIGDGETLNLDEEKPFNIMQYVGKIKSFAKIKDPVAWQKEIRSEWDREWDQ